MSEEWIGLPLFGFPGELLNVRVTTDWAKEAEARYAFTGKRLHGVIRVRCERDRAPAGIFTHVHLGYGDRTSEYNPWRSRHRYTDRPVVNGARLGCDGVVTALAALQNGTNLTAWDLGARRDYPERAGRRFVATVQTIVRHWIARPDLRTVRHVAAVHQAVSLYHDMTHRQSVLADRIDELTAEYVQLERDLAPVKALYDQNDTLLADLGLNPPAAPSRGQTP